ncbi:hypothetical protein SKAU_G00323450 [Synaphobranchus kaupii]|uniref:Uncharacterized protein n=1 Tax=Synaphobranchus kaupii TaxID=118154 RepID=A0A9Q1EP70_SYNKA|nr:hypothetical protein SKAU_G00323450 [Synaphobranchus kaupii]
MRVLITVALLCTLSLPGLRSQCPSPGSLKDPEGTKLCARMFTDSHENSTLSCLGEHMNVYPQDDYPFLPRSWNDQISSLVVSRFCSLKVWSRTKKEGKRQTFRAGIQHRLKDVRMGLFRNWDNQISAFYYAVFGVSGTGMRFDLGPVKCRSTEHRRQLNASILRTTGSTTGHLHTGSAAKV